MKQVAENHELLEDDILKNRELCATFEKELKVLETVSTFLHKSMDDISNELREILAFVDYTTEILTLRGKVAEEKECKVKATSDDIAKFEEILTQKESSNKMLSDTYDLLEGAVH